MRGSVSDLIRDLEFRSDLSCDCWVAYATGRRYALVVPAMYGPLDFLRLVDISTVQDALSDRRISLGDPELMPRYNYGGPRYRWKTIQQGRRISLRKES